MDCIIYTYSNDPVMPGVCVLVDRTLIHSASVACGVVFVFINTSYIILITNLTTSDISFLLNR